MDIYKCDYFNLYFLDIKIDEPLNKKMKENLDLRVAGKNDIPLIRALAKICFYDTYRKILSAEQLDYMYDMMYSEASLNLQISEGHYFVLAYKGEECAGYVSYQFEQGNSAHLHKLYILPAFQGCGIGRVMIEYVFAKVKEYYHGDSCSVELNVNRQNCAYHFYKKLGMNEVASGDFPIGGGYYMCDYIMRKDL